MVSLQRLNLSMMLHLELLSFTGGCIVQFFKELLLVQECGFKLCDGRLAIVEISLEV